jgi:alpha-tubulin suppressor-like RCC1 family protein
VTVSTSGALAGKPLSQISAGEDIACALDTLGAAYCWGVNETGSLTGKRKLAPTLALAESRLVIAGG